MKLAKQITGLWIKATERMPHHEYNSWITTWCTASGAYVEWKNENEVLDLRTNEWVYGIEWLESFEDVFVLTEDELKDILMKFDDTIPGEINVSEFIKSITK